MFVIIRILGYLVISIRDRNVPMEEVVDSQPDCRIAFVKKKEYVAVSINRYNFFVFHDFLNL